MSVGEVYACRKFSSAITSNGSNADANLHRVSIDEHSCKRNGGINMQHTIEPTREYGREHWALLAIVVAAAVARFTFIGRDPFWMDESATWWFATRPLRELWTQVPLYEAHPPLYYSLIRGWRFFFGDTEAALRSFSAIASLAVVPLVYLIGKVTLPGRSGIWLALCAAAFTAVNPMQIRYAQEARSYALLTMCATVLMLAFLWLINHPHVFEEWWASRRARARSIWMFAGVALIAAVAFWMHQTAPLTVGLLIAIGAALLSGLVGGSRRLFVSLCVFGVLILALWGRDIPWLARGAAMIHEGFWIAQPDIRALIDVSDALFGTWNVADSPAVRSIAVVLAVSIAAFGARTLMRRGAGPAAVFLLAAMCAPILVAFVASHAIAPIFIPRIVLWTNVPFILLAAAAVLALTESTQRVVVASAVCALMAVIVGVRAAMPAKEDWREVAQILEREAAPNDLVVVVTPYAEVPLLYYDAAERTSAHWLSLPKTFPGTIDSEGVPAGFRLIDKVDAKTLERVAALSRHSRKVWFVIRGRTSYDANDAIVGTIERTHPRAVERVRFADLQLLTEFRG